MTRAYLYMIRPAARGPHARPPPVFPGTRAAPARGDRGATRASGSQRLTNDRRFAIIRTKSRTTLPSDPTADRFADPTQTSFCPTMARMHASYFLDQDAARSENNCCSTVAMIASCGVTGYRFAIASGGVHADASYNCKPEVECCWLRMPCLDCWYGSICCIHVVAARSIHRCLGAPFAHTPGF